MKHAYTDIPSGQVYYESEGAGEPLVCLHQTHWSSREFVNLIPLLAKSFRVIAPDLPGYGLSDAAPHKWCRVEDWTAAMRQFLDALGLKKVTLVGSHASAKLALELAAAYPGRVKAAVLYGCGIYDKNQGRGYDLNAPWPKQDQTTTLTERIALTRKLQQAKAEIPVSGLHFYETWNDLIRLEPAAEAEIIQNAFLACVRAYDKRCSFNSGTLSDLDYKLEVRAPLVKCPVMLAVGSNDVIRAPIYQAPEAAAKLIRGCKVARIEGAGNFGLSSSAPPLAREILAFLKKT
jgi:pimeloyl-ACP methyl ester carboxylesterase